MSERLSDGAPFVHEGNGLVAETPRDEPFPDVVYRLFRRVQHVGGIEPVVAQLVHYNFVGGEIVDYTSCTSLTSKTSRTSSNSLFNGQQ